MLVSCDLHCKELKRVCKRELSRSRQRQRKSSHHGIQRDHFLLKESTHFNIIIEIQKLFDRCPIDLLFQRLTSGRIPIGHHPSSRLQRMTGNLTPHSLPSLSSKFQKVTVFRTSICHHSSRFQEATGIQTPVDHQDPDGSPTLMLPVVIILYFPSSRK